MENILGDGGPAYPVADYDHQTFSPRTVDECRRLLSGMSLRDYFAAAYLKGAASDASIVWGGNERHAQAKIAYQVADAMLAARKEGGAA